MGQKIQNIIRLAGEHIGDGVLEEIIWTRLKYIIGNELFQKAGELDDTPELIDLVEKGVLALYEPSQNDQRVPSFVEKTTPKETPGSDEILKGTKTAPAKSGQQLVLKLKSNHSNAQVELFGHPLMFSPVFLENELYSLLDQMVSLADEDLPEQVTLLAKKQALDLLEKTLNKNFSPRESLRSGLLLLKGMGYATYRIRQSDTPWKIDFHLKQAHPWTRLFLHGYLEALFELVYHQKFNLSFELNPQKSFEKLNDDSQETAAGAQNRASTIWTVLVTPEDQQDTGASS